MSRTYGLGHDLMLVCNLENKPYHAKCLKICNDAAHELQQSSDWFCPLCLENIIPFFNCAVIEQIIVIDNFKFLKIVSFTDIFDEIIY